MGRLSAKQARFVEEFLIDLNGTKAAVRSGYSPRTANEQAARLLAKVSIQEQVQAAMAKRSERTEITQDMVVKELAAIGFSSIGDYLEWFGDTVTLRDSAELTPEQMRVVAEVGEVVTAGGAKTIKIKLHDKQTALEKLAKHLGMYIDRTEITGKDGGPALVTLADLRKRAFEERQASEGGSTDATSEAQE